MRERKRFAKVNYAAGRTRRNAMAAMSIQIGQYIKLESSIKKINHFKFESFKLDIIRLMSRETTSSKSLI